MRISGRGGAWMWLPAVCLLSSALVADVAVKAPFDGPVHHPRIMPADFMNIRLELAFDWERESIQGRATHTLRVLQDGLRTLTLDAVRMTFTAVRDGEGRSLEHRAFDDRIEIDLPNPAGAGDEIEITIAYQCVPEKGIYFVSPDPRYPDRPRQVWSQGEAEESRHWYPCFDSPAERVSSEVIATVPEPLEVLSNGVLRSVRENPDDGTRTFHWVQERAHVNYLITVVAGVYEKLEDSWDGIPVTSWHYRGDGERARRSFLLTADMMECFSSLFGPYPWSKYDQIVVRDFLWGGMENTTATTLTDRTLHEAEDEPSTSSRGLVAHELAHQWFGDLVTCRDWADLWLNESFATFCATLYTEHHLGRPEAQMERLDQKASYLSEDRESYRRPLSCRTYRDPEVMFDRHSYPKGARILQMLRHMLGDEPFFAGVREYLRRHAFLSVESAQLRRALEDHTGEPLAWFFDQWIRHGGHPELRVRKSYDPETGILTLDVEQTQQVDHLTPLFRLPVEVGIYGEGEQVVVKEIEVRHAQGTFTFQVPFRPSFVRFDRSSVLLMELDLEKPRGEWIEQLRRDPDTLGRVAAARALGDIIAATADGRVISELTERLRSEAFWGVRRAIAEALGKGVCELAAPALERALAEEADPRVREGAAASLGRLGCSSSLAALEQAFSGDRSDWVRRACLRAHRDIDLEGSRDLARRALEVSSHQEMVREAALKIVEEIDDGDALPLVLALAASGAPRASRLEAIRVLARIGKGREEALEHLLAQAGDPHRPTRRAAYEALGHWGGERAREALVERRQRERRDEMREAIRAAIARVDRPETLEAMTRKLSDVEKGQRALERRLEELESERKGRRHARRY